MSYISELVAQLLDADRKAHDIEDASTLPAEPLPPIILSQEQLDAMDDTLTF